MTSSQHKHSDSSSNPQATPSSSIPHPLDPGDGHDPEAIVAGSPSAEVECFQNFTAPEVFIQGLAGMVNQQDIATIIKSQKYMLQRFEKTNEMLINCNQLSATRFQNASKDFKRHTAMLQEMKKDIDNIFKRIRNIKAKISQQYPQAYDVAAAEQRKEKLQGDEDDEEEDDEDNVVEAMDRVLSLKSPSVSSMPADVTSTSRSADSPSSSSSSYGRPMEKSASIDISSSKRTS